LQCLIGPLRGQATLPQGFVLNTECVNTTDHCGSGLAREEARAGNIYPSA